MNPETASAAEEVNLDLIRFWDADPVVVNTGLDEAGYSMDINLVDFLGKGCRILTAAGFFVLPLSFGDPKDDATRKEVIRRVRKACMMAGFTVTSNGVSNGRLVFMCTRGRPAGRRTKKDCDVQIQSPIKKRRGAGSSKPREQDRTCPFRIVFIETTMNNADGNLENRWAIMPAIGCREHRWHDKLLAKDVKTSASLLPEAEMQLACDLAETQASARQMAELLRIRGHGNFSPQQMEYVQKLSQNIESDPSVRDRGTSSADKLLKLLEDAQIPHVAHFDTPDSELIGITAQRADNHRKRPVRVVSKNYRGSVEDAQAEEIDVSTFHAGDLESLDQYRARIRKEMIVNRRGTESDKILLAVAWATHEMQKMFERYPEVIAADVTSQTNSEMRPLFLLAGKTADNQTFIALAAFLPRQSRWVFDWIFRFAVPLLLPQTALERVNLLMTDGDEKEYNPFLQVAETIYPQAAHGLCVWHIIDRGWKDKGITASGLDKEGQGPPILRAVKTYLFSWSKDVESDLEFDTSYRLLLA